MEKINTVNVNIFGMQFTLRSQDEPSYLRELAQMVDSKMRELAQQTKAISTTNLAVLVALNIADELMKFKKEAQQKQELAANKVENVLRLIENVETQ